MSALLLSTVACDLSEGEIGVLEEGEDLVALPSLYMPQSLDYCGGSGPLRVGNVYSSSDGAWILDYPSWVAVARDGGRAATGRITLNRISIARDPLAWIRIHTGSLERMPLVSVRNGVYRYEGSGNAEVRNFICIGSAQNPSHISSVRTCDAHDSCSRGECVETTIPATGQRALIEHWHGYSGPYATRNEWMSMELDSDNFDGTAEVTMSFDAGDVPFEARVRTNVDLGNLALCGLDRDGDGRFCQSDADAIEAEGIYTTGDCSPAEVFDGSCVDSSTLLRAHQGGLLRGGLLAAHSSLCSLERSLSPVPVRRDL